MQNIITLTELLNLISLIRISSYVSFLLFPIICVSQPDTTPGTESLNTHINHSNGYQKASILWSEDFSSGFPTGWTIDNPSGLCPWTYSLDGSWGYYNGNNGTSAATTLNSSTALNGFLICDIDSANNANFGQPSSSNYQYISSYFVTDRIDLTGNPDVLLEFEHSFRLNNSADLEVMISNDSINWTTWTVQHNVYNNDPSPNVLSESFNISSVAGNQDTVYIKIGWTARVYYWMIDDILIVTAPNNDLVVSDAQFDNYIKYSQYPISQVQPMNFSALLTNRGSATQHNSMLVSKVYDSGLINVFTGTSTMQDLLSANSSLMLITSTYTPSAIDSYSIVCNSQQTEIDDISSNDSVTDTFVVTDSIYARESGLLYSEFWTGNDGSGNANPMEYGNLFEFVNNDYVTSVSMYIGASSQIGEMVYATVYEIVNEMAGQFTLVDKTPNHTLGLSDIGNWITIPMANPVGLTAGKKYLIVAGTYGGGASVYFEETATIAPMYTSFYQDAVSWYSTSRCAMVRVNTNYLLGINDISDFSGFSVYPNPTSSSINVNIAVQVESPITLTLFNALGKCVLTLQTKLNNGLNTINIDLEYFPEGIYTLSIRYSNQLSAKKIIIFH